MYTRSQLSPTAFNIRSSNCPARPTKGRPMRSSSPPGASPTNMTLDPGAPSANTSWVAVLFKAQPSKRSSVDRRVARSGEEAARTWAAPSATGGAVSLPRERLVDKSPLPACRATPFGEAISERPSSGAAASENRLRGASSMAIVTPACDHHLNAAAASAVSSVVRFLSAIGSNLAPLPGHAGESRWQVSLAFATRRRQISMPTLGAHSSPGPRTLRRARALFAGPKRDGLETAHI